MFKLRAIYESLLASGDLPSYYSGDWKTDKKQFELEYSSNNVVYGDVEFDDTY